MLVLLKHATHGSMYVYSQNEVDRHAVLGWLPEQKEINPIVSHETVEPPVKRRGRPPKGQ